MGLVVVVGQVQRGGRKLGQNHLHHVTLESKTAALQLSEEIDYSGSFVRNVDNSPERPWSDACSPFQGD